MVNLTTLAPDIVAAILDETLPVEVTLFELAAGTPLLWEEQWERVEGDCAHSAVKELSASPERRREDHKQCVEFQPADNHGKTQDPLG